MSNLFIPSNVVIESLLAPAADAAGRTGSVYRDLGDCQEAYLVVYVDQGNAATIALDPKQASDASGTGSKALTSNVPIWSNQDMAAGTAYTRATSDAKTFTTSAAVKIKAVIFKIVPESLDVANSFRYVSVTTGASNAANITSALLIKVMRYSK